MLKDVYTLEDLKQWEIATAGIAPPIRLAVTGDPVAHSASPQMHNAALAKCGIDASYTRLHLLPGEIAEGLRLLASKGFLGLNVTIPHKAAVLSLVDEVDEHARKIGAVNTIAVRGSRLFGFNTDGPGMVRAVQAELGADIRDLRVMVLGAGGGAGRAIAVQCALERCQRLVLVNRTFEKGLNLANELSEFLPEVAALAWEESALEYELKNVDLVINATSVGMKPGDNSPLPAALIPSNLMIYDTIYTSNRTALMRAADEVGAKSANGFSMLLHQGALAFEIWFNRPAPLEEMRAALLNLV